MHLLLMQKYFCFIFKKNRTDLKKYWTVKKQYFQKLLQNFQTCPEVNYKVGNPEEFSISHNSKMLKSIFNFVAIL